MTVGGWVYNRIISSSNVNAIINGNCYPGYIEYINIPGVSYSFVSQKKNNLIMRSPIISISCIEDTQDECIALNDYLFNLFDNSTTRIYENSSGLKIESVSIENNLPAVFDEENRKWIGILDIKINYIK